MPTDHPPTRGPAHDQLDAFVGRWRVEGRNGDGAGPAANTGVTGEESYEWMPGGFFLLYRWDRHFGGGAQHIGIGIVGYDVSKSAYVAHHFDNLGYARTYDVSVSDRTLTLTGPWERATITVAADTLAIHWERADDGTHWQPLCDLTGTPIPPVSPPD